MSSPTKKNVVTKTAKPAVAVPKEKESKPVLTGAAVGTSSTLLVPSAPVDPSPALPPAIPVTITVTPPPVVAPPIAPPVPEVKKSLLDSALQGMRVYTTSLVEFIAEDLNGQVVTKEKIIASATKYDANAIATVSSQAGKRTRSIPSEKKPKKPTKIAGKICEFVPSGGRGSKCKDEVSVNSKTGKYCSRHMRKEKEEAKKSAASSNVKDAEDKKKAPKKENKKKQEEDEVEDNSSNEEEEVEIAPDDD
jgi:hypothetical protein